MIKYFASRVERRRLHTCGKNQGKEAAIFMVLSWFCALRLRMLIMRCSCVVLLLISEFAKEVFPYLQNEKPNAVFLNSRLAQL